MCIWLAKRSIKIGAYECSMIASICELICICIFFDCLYNWRAIHYGDNDKFLNYWNEKKKWPATEQFNRPHQKINCFMFILTLWRVKRNTYFVESHFVESVYIMYIHIYPTSRNDWIYANYLFRSETFVHANVVGNQSSFLPKAKYVVLSLIITKKWL